MIQIKNFTVTKAPEPKTPNDNLPQRKLSANIGTKEVPNYVEIGSGWIKNDKNNVPYISVSLGDERSYQKNDGSVVNLDGWSLVRTKDVNKLYDFYKTNNSASSNTPAPVIQKVAPQLDEWDRPIMPSVPVVKQQPVVPAGLTVAQIDYGTEIDLNDIPFN